MIPILFEKTATTFTGLGIGALSDCISCTVRRVLNGMDELEMSYPESGIRASDLENSRIICAVPEWKKTTQPYRIYDITKPMNGIFYVYARHISEQRSYIPVMPFTASNVSDALSSISTYCAETCPFTFWTDKTTVANFSITAPRSLGALLGGSAGSILDVYGGEYEFDGYTVKLWNRRGEDRGVTLRYGKNITDIRQEESIDATITGICPFWEDMDGNVVTLTEKVIRSANAQNFPFNRTVVKDFSYSFDEQPTEAQLRAAAQAYVSQTGFGVPDVNIKVSFEMLSQYKEYEDLTSLESVNLGDTVHVIFERLNVNADARVVEIRYDTLNDRYKSISIGKVRSNMSTTIKEIEDNSNQNVEQTKTFLEQAIEDATEQLTGENGGYLVDLFNNNGERIGDMIMDTNDPSTATNVWLRNLAGWGHSSTGVNGTYTLAITQDGKIVADFIKTGTLQSVKIIAEDGSVGGWKISSNILDKSTGYTEGVASSVYRAFISAPSNPTVGHLAFGLEKQNYDGSSLSYDSYLFYITYGGKLYAKSAEIEGKFTANLTGGGTAKIDENGFTITNMANETSSLSGGGLRLSGHASVVGSTYTSSLSSQMNLSASTTSCTEVCSLSLTAGRWLIFGYVCFGGTTSSARRVATIATTSGAYNAYIRNDTQTNTTETTTLEVSGILNFANTTTHYLNAASSVACTVQAQASFLHAIRIT